MVKQKFLFFLICSLLIVSAQALDYDPQGKLIFSLGGEVSVMNPILATDTASGAVNGVVFSGMFKINEKLEIIPDLCRSYKVSPNGKVWTFYLRKDVKWHDGHPFTAYDVKFTFDSILNPKVNSVRRSDYIIDGVPIRFYVIDRYTVRAVLPEPFAPFLARSSMAIIPRHILYGKDINTARFNQHPVGTGPFRFVEYKAGNYVKLERFEDFYDGRPLLKEIIYKIIPDSNSSLVALESGQVDTAGIPSKDYRRMKTVKGINVFNYDALTYTYLGLNLDNPIFKDKKVRQALAHATNKKQIISLVFRGMASPAYCPSSPVCWAYSNNVEKYPFDLDKANKMLEEAGWKMGKNGIREKDGKKMEFSILVNQGNKEREKTAIILQQQYKKAGAKVNVRVMEWSAILKVLNDPTPPREFDTVLIGWSLGIDPDQYSIWHSSQYPKGFNFIHYSNPEVDRLLVAGRLTLPEWKRKRIYARMNRIISEDQPYIFLYYPEAIEGVRDRVGGLSKPGPAGLFLNIEKVYIKKD